MKYIWFWGWGWWFLVGVTKTREKSAEEYRVSNQEKVTKWLEVNRRRRGEEGEERQAWGDVGNRADPVIIKSENNWGRRSSVTSNFILHSIFSQADSNAFYAWTLRLLSKNYRWWYGSVCVIVLWVCVISNLVTRLVSIPIVPWDCCSSEEEWKRNYISLLWESSYLTAKQGTPYTQEDVNPFHPQSTYVLSLQTVGQMIWSLFSLNVLHIPLTFHSKPTHAFSGGCWLQAKFWIPTQRLWHNNNHHHIVVLARESHAT